MDYKIYYFNVFWQVVVPCSISEISPLKQYFLSLRPTNKMKSSTLVSTPIGILKKILILNILLQLEFWVHFQCLLYSNYRMTWKLSLHHDVCLYNVHTWWNFQIFWTNFAFDVIFLHFFFKNSHKNQFPSEKSKFLVSKEDM